MGHMEPLTQTAICHAVSGTDQNICMQAQGIFSKTVLRRCKSPFSNDDRVTKIRMTGLVPWGGLGTGTGRRGKCCECHGGGRRQAPWALGGSRGLQGGSDLVLFLTDLGFQDSFGLIGKLRRWSRKFPFLFKPRGLHLPLPPTRESPKVLSGIEVCGQSTILMPENRALSKEILQWRNFSSHREIQLKSPQTHTCSHLG